MARNNNAASGTTEAPARDYTQRRWMKPSKRAKGYAEERKKKSISSARKKDRSLRNTKRAYVRDICFAVRTAPVRTYTDRLSRTVRRRKKRQSSPVPKESIERITLLNKTRSKNYG